MRRWITELASQGAATRDQAATRLLARGPDAIAPLLEAAAGENIVYAEPARELLPRFGPEAIDALALAGYRDFTAGRHQYDLAEEAVARMGEAALPRVLEIFTRAEPIGFASGVLYRLNGLAVQPLLPLLGHPNKTVRQQAASLLASFGDPRSYDALLEGLHSADQNVRMYSARGLGNIRDPRAGKELLSALGDPDWGTQRAAAAALGKIWDVEFRAPVAKLARLHPQILVRDTAANVLIHSGDPVASRIGRRYKPIALSPASRAAIEFAYLARLGITGLLLLAVTVVAGRAGAQPAGAGRWLVVAAAGVVAFSVGWYWGYAIENIQGYVEYMLLLGCAPAALILGLLIGILQTAFRQPLARAGFGLVAGSFYSGYGLGWLALWGYLGT